MTKPKPKLPKLIAACNIIGPNGEIIVFGSDDNEIPSDWPEEFLQSLIDSGGAVPVSHAEHAAKVKDDK